MYSPFFRTFSSGLSRSMIGFTNGDCIWTFFSAIFIVDEWVTISAFTGSNVTMPYAEIGASFNNSYFGLLLWGVVFVVLISSLELRTYTCLWQKVFWYKIYSFLQMSCVWLMHYYLCSFLFLLTFMYNIHHLVNCSYFQVQFFELFSGY